MATRRRSAKAEDAAAQQSAPELPPAISTDVELKTQLAKLVKHAPPLRPVLKMAGKVPLRSLDAGFKGLLWVISGQQISAAAGKAIFLRCEAALGGTISAECVLAIDDAALKAAGLSSPKIRTLRAVASAIDQGQLDLDGLIHLDAETAIAQMITVKGIGRWTAEVYLLFALGHPDIFPAGDLALKEAARLAFGLPERPAEKELVAHAQEWRPYRSAAARLLWAYYGVAKLGRDATPA